MEDARTPSIPSTRFDDMLHNHVRVDMNHWGTVSSAGNSNGMRDFPMLGATRMGAVICSTWITCHVLNLEDIAQGTQASMRDQFATLTS